MHGANLMKLNLQRETLLKPLQQVIGVVERKQTLPILSNVLLRTKDNKLSITGTDLEVELVGHSEQPAQTGDYQITVPGRKLMDICKALPEDAPIELYQNNEKVTLRSGRSRFTLSTLPADDFPSVEDQTGDITFGLSQKDFRYLLNRTAFAMAQQDVRYYLNGLLLEVNDKNLRAVATDGHRLAMNIIDTDIATDHRVQIIIPRKGITELMRLLEDVDATVQIAINKNHLKVVGPHFTFTSKLIDGRFPDYSRVIPMKSTKSIIVDCDTLSHALQRTAILCNEKFRGVRFELRKDLLKILANNPEQEAAEEELNVEYKGEDLDIGFNVNYLLDLLNVVKSGAVKLNFTTSDASMLIEEASSSENSKFVIMPMRL